MSVRRFLTNSLVPDLSTSIVLAFTSNGTDLQYFCGFKGLRYESRLHKFDFIYLDFGGCFHLIFIYKSLDRTIEENLLIRTVQIQ